MKLNRPIVRDDDDGYVTIRDDLGWSTSRGAVIDHSKDARKESGLNFGSESTWLTRSDVQALLDGNDLAISVNAGEYKQFIFVREMESK